MQVSAAMVMEDRPRVSWTTFMWYPSGQTKRGHAVPQVTQPDRRQPCLSGKPTEGAGQRAVVGSGP